MTAATLTPTEPNIEDALVQRVQARVDRFGLMTVSRELEITLNTLKSALRGSSLSRQTRKNITRTLDDLGAAAHPMTAPAVADATDTKGSNHDEW